MSLLAWFMLGTIVGSFLNVCIYRLPLEQSIVRPGSHCRACKHPIAWYDNVPILSFLALGAKCRHCRAPIALRYPLVEVLTGLATVAVVSRFGVQAPSLIYLAFVWALIAASFIDLDYRIIPDEISLGGLAIGLIISPLVPQLHGSASWLIALKRSCIGALVGGGLLYVTGVLGTLAFKKEAMGGGDVKLLAMAGSLLGWQAVTLAFFLAPLLAIGPGLAVLLLRKSHEIPYGPFLAAALLVALFGGDAVLRLLGLDETIRILLSPGGMG